MKRTRKWAFVAQEVHRLVALGLTPYAIAKRLSLSPSTVLRWKQAGKLKAAKAPAKPRKGRVSSAPAAWANQVRADYALDSTDEQLVILAQHALELAHNMTEAPTVRLAASARFQAIEKRLALRLRQQAETPPAAEEKPTRAAAPARPPRTGGDPRSFLQAVK